MAGPKETDDLLPTRQTLLSRLRNWGDEESWRDFFNTYWRLIYGSALRSGLNDAEAQDVVQETILCVARKIKTFRYDPGRGSFKGWLLKITHWRILDQLRRRHKLQTIEPLPENPDFAELENIPDPNADLEGYWNTEWEKVLLEAALERVKLRVKPEHFQIFDLYALKNWPVSKVAETLGVKEDLVYLVKHRISETLKQELQNLETNFV
ncbi:MAG: sigma-70 family RNA polymerase sigma factor [Verrucomicrobiota bacterium]